MYPTRYEPSERPRDEMKALTAKLVRKVSVVRASQPEGASSRMRNRLNQLRGMV